MSNARRINKYKVISFVFLMVFVLSLYSNHIFPFRYEIVISASALLFFLLILTKKSKTLSIIFILSMFFLTFGLFYSQSIFQQIFQNANFETNKISYIKLKENKITKENIGLNTVFGKSVGFDIDNSKQIDEDLLSRFDFNVSVKNTESDFDTVKGLYSGELEIGIIDNALIDAITEEYPYFNVDFEVLWSIERQIIREDISKDVPVDKDSFIMLISGIDIDGSISLRSRSDVNILMVVNPNKGKIALISIPRDMFVPLSCRNDELDKLTHTGIYGINCTVQTIENFLDIDINYYVRMNFTSFIKIIDVIGKIEVYSNYNFTNTTGQYYFQKGINILDSQQALAFARERKAFEGGDVQRGLNQQEVIKAVIKKLISPSTIVKIDRIVNSVAKSIDTNLDAADVQKLIALQIDKNLDWEFDSYHVEGLNGYKETFSVPGRELFVVIPNPDSVIMTKKSIYETMK